MIRFSLKKKLFYLCVASPKNQLFVCVWLLQKNRYFICVCGFSEKTAFLFVCGFSKKTDILFFAEILGTTEEDGTKGMVGAGLGLQARREGFPELRGRASHARGMRGRVREKVE